MGTLGGHLLPGSFFLLFGLWWCYNIFRSYYLCVREQTLSLRSSKAHSRYRSKLFFTGSCSCCKRCRNLPLEAMLLLTFCTIGIIGETITGFKGGKFVKIGNGQHITMYFFFALMALVSILMHFRYPLPPDTDYLAALLALGVELLLFLYHLHGRTPLDVQVHQFLLYLIAAGAISGLLEMKYKNNVLPALARTFFLVLQGTWFIHVGFILYPPPFVTPWKQDDHTQMMIVTIIFAWHLAGVFIYFFIVATTVHCSTKRMSKPEVMKALDIKATRHEGGANGMGLHNTMLNDEQTRRIIVDTDEEEEEEL